MCDTVDHRGLYWLNLEETYALVPSYKWDVSVFELDTEFLY